MRATHSTRDDIMADLRYRTANAGDKLRVGIFMTSGIVAGMTAVGIFGYQVYFYLRWGGWRALPLSELLGGIGIDTTALYAPQSWQGAAKIGRWLVELPSVFVVPVTIFVLGWLISRLFPKT